AKRDAVNRRESDLWHHLGSRADWEKYRDERINKLRESLGSWPEPPEKIDVRVTGTVTGPGYRIDNIVFESRPGLLVTANRYRPEKPTQSMPGVVIAHSHHNGKAQGGLQDM